MANQDEVRPLTFNLGSAEKLSDGIGHCFVVCGEEIAIFRQRDGRIFAVQNRCPHKNGPLSEGISGDGKVVCPLHSHKFDLSSGKGGEPRECLKTYAVRVFNGEILLSFPTGDAAAPEPECAARHA
ncbi:MAG TPA: nitrite reductase (NAD(P)H) small subunit [Planctomycetota bacterium]|nr:nitrite reductase (NAD(P)H) small subunit [Planctomycetota bacterium]